MFRLILTLFVLQLTNANELDYGMVMDVGSTHTQLYVYAWSHRVTSTSDSPESKPYEIGASRRASPGIQDTTPQSYDGIVTYLKPLIADAKNLTKHLSSRWDTFPIYFKATAGMRILNEYRRTEILSWVRSVLGNSSINPFLFENDNAVILSGEEEAMFDWLTVNYLNNKLFDDSSSSSSDDSLVSTFGSLDLGGESTQITFAALPSSDILQSFTNVHLWNNNYRLYTHSFLEYGSDAMYDRIGQLSYEQTLIYYNISSASQENDFISDIVNRKYFVNNPCLNNGFNDSFNVSLVYNDGLYHNLTQYGSSIDSFRLSSQTGYNKCRGYIKKLFYNDTVCLTGTDSCNINGVYQKSIYYRNMTFYAFSGFAYTIIDFDLSKNVNLDEIYNISNNICNMTYLQLNSSVWTQKLIENGAYSYLSNRCMMMTYVFSLLHDAYGFPAQNSNIVFVATTANGTSAYDWTQGSILRDANWLTYTLKDSSGLTKMGKVYEYIAFSALGVLLVTCILLIYCVVRMKGNDQKAYGKMESQ